MKKKKRGGSSKVVVGDEPFPVLGLAAPPASPKMDVSLCGSQPGLLESPSGKEAVPDLIVATMENVVSGCSDEECSSDGDCSSDEDSLDAGPYPAKETTEISEAIVGIQPSVSGKVSGPTSGANVKPKMGPWRNLFADNRAANSETMLSLFSQVSESKSCILLEEDTPCDEWKRCLIGYVAGKYPGFAALKSIITNHWKCDATLFIHENGWLVYEFKEEKDKLDVLNGGPYLVYGRPLMLKSMPEYFDFSKKEMSSVPVWVKLPNLPLKCWSIRSLSKICSLIGKPIQCDRLTATKARISYARVLIEVDLRESLPDTIQIGLPNGQFIDQLVIFESLPRFCKTCNSIGHLSDSCGKNSTPLVRGQTSSGIPPATGNAPRRMLRASSAGPVARKSGTENEVSNNGGSKTGLTEVWIPVGHNGKASGNVKRASQIAGNQSDAPQQPVPPAEAVQATKGKGKEVMVEEAETEGQVEPEPGQSGEIDPKASEFGNQASGCNQEGTAVNNPELPKETDVRKSTRKPKKMAKGVPTSSTTK